MAKLSHVHLPLHLLEDTALGLVHVVAEVEGALVPIATQKLGHLEQMIANAGLMSVQPPEAEDDPAVAALASRLDALEGAHLADRLTALETKLATSSAPVVEPTPVAPVAPVEPAPPAE